MARTRAQNGTEKDSQEGLKMEWRTAKSEAKLINSWRKGVEKDRCNERRSSATESPTFYLCYEQ